jgi:hypothetical protein
MVKPMDVIMPMLRDMRAESEARHGEVLARFDRVEQRLKKLEDVSLPGHPGRAAGAIRDPEARAAANMGPGSALRSGRDDRGKGMSDVG